VSHLHAEKAMHAEVNFACETCGNGLVLPLGGEPQRLRCPRCSREASLLDVRSDVPRSRCAACGSPALFVQSDFNRKLGIAVVLLAALFAVRTWGLSLVLAALIDLGLYRFLPRITVCYACDAIHRGVPSSPAQQAFDHEVAEEFKEAKSRHRLAVQQWLRAHGARGDAGHGAPG
jgi:hypothetical protein